MHSTEHIYSVSGKELQSSSLTQWGLCAFMLSFIQRIHSVPRSRCWGYSEEHNVGAPPFHSSMEDRKLRKQISEVPLAPHPVP